MDKSQVSISIDETNLNGKNTNYKYLELSEDEKEIDYINTLEIANTNERSSNNFDDKYKEEIAWLKTLKDNRIDHSIGQIHEAPHFLQDNEHIIKGYRINFFSKRKIFRSLFMCHNETFNIWSHLLMVIFCIYLIYINDNNINNSLNLLNSEQIWHIHKLNHSNTLNEMLPHLYNERLFYLDIISYLETNKYIDNEYLNKITIIANKRINLEKIKEKVIQNITFQKVEELLKNLYTLKKQLEKIQLLFVPILTNINKNHIEIVKLKEIFEEKETYFFSYIQLINIESSKYLKKYLFIKEDETPEVLIGDYLYSKREFKLLTWPIHVFLYLAIICFMNSAVYHLFSAYGENANAFFSRLDYAGISLLISGSCIPPYYYLYYCSSYYKSIFVGFIFSCSFMVFILTLTPNFNKPIYRKVRGILFLTLGISAASPLIHLFFFFNSSIGMLENPILRYWIGGGLLYISGVIVYLSRQPEKKCKGRFDYCGASHQIWHLFTIIGMLTHYMGCLGSYYDRILQECPNI